MPLKLKEYLLTIIYRLIYLIIRILSHIPFRICQFIGRTLGLLFDLIPMKRTDVSLDNLRYVFEGDLNENEIRRLNRRVLMHFGEMLFEIPHLFRLNSENLDNYVIFENQQNLLAALDKGKGVFALTAHLGNWELLNTAVPLYFGIKTAAVARPIEFLPVERLFSDLRSRFGTDLIQKQRGIKRILTAIKDKKLVGILLDQSVDWYEGVFVEFMGRPACTNKALARLVQKTGAPVVPAFCVKQPDGRYKIIFDEEVNIQKSADKTIDVEQNTALFTAIIEKHVREYPEQWFWFHRRWKVKNYCPLPDDNVS
ncbi:MAG TPA: lysophospholipid acyltransferase family protein [Desulfobacteraceae bacterium]|nr:lysophospholipid acyltransferase family protein [Desulfobacteraceae bacterium]HPJ67517.1 lysophospholipid acyltransferase family protein [Desulfobacteraceae bacterium]HPQ28883.1 lysophospholipid acyltransferase family protein [Desulfobacteraceae bacterium]